MDLSGPGIDVKLKERKKEGNPYWPTLTSVYPAYLQVAANSDDSQLVSRYY
jgi:hypothetical protein